MHATGRFAAIIGDPLPIHRLGLLSGEAVFIRIAQHDPEGRTGESEKAADAEKCAIVATSGPETRTIPIPPRPGGVATAAIVSGARAMFDEAIGDRVQLSMLAHLRNPPCNQPLLGDR